MEARCRASGGHYLKTKKVMHEKAPRPSHARGGRPCGAATTESQHVDLLAMKICRFNQQKIIQVFEEEEKKKRKP
jgi:hypothetical protein